MNTKLKDILSAAEQLPETDQKELADQIEDLIVERKIAAAESDITKGRVSTLDDSFQRIIEKLTNKYGESSTT